MTKNNVTAETIAFEIEREAGIARLGEGIRAAMGVKELADKVKAEGASAVNLMIAGTCAPGVLNLPITFDVRDKSGAIVESASASLLEYANDIGFRNTDGGAYRAKQSAFKAAMLNFLGVNPDKGESAWRMYIQKALPGAVHAFEAGVTVTLNDKGALTFEGGEGPEAEAIRKCANAAQLGKLAKGDTAKPDATAKGQGDTRPATLHDILKEACRMLRLVEAGKEALAPSVAGDLRAVVKLASAVLAKEGEAA
jgi:hypothetical protein